MRSSLETLALNVYVERITFRPMCNGQLEDARSAFHSSMFMPLSKHVLLLYCCCPSQSIFGR